MPNSEYVGSPTVPIPDSPITASNATTPRKRKPRAAKPVVERKPRKKPTTLLARIKAMGEHHVSAFRVLSGYDFDAALRAEFSHVERLAKAEARADRAAAELEAAVKARDEVMAERFADGDAGKTLDDLARKIAEAKGDPIDDAAAQRERDEASGAFGKPSDSQPS